MATEEVSTPLPLTDHKDLQGIQAAILELDWEVSDKGLRNLADQLNVLKSRYAGDRYIQVLIQGLHSLNAYIMEEKGRAHPETFSLLHNFYDALETLVEKETLGEEQRQDILIDCVNRLNNLKNLIAQTYPTEDLAPEAVTPVPESEAPPEEELAIESQTPTPEDQYPAGGLAQESETELSQRQEGGQEPSTTSTGGEMEEPEEVRGGEEKQEITPALADSPEQAGFGGSGDLEAPPEELEEKLDFFFGEDKEEFAPEAIEEAIAARKAREQVDGQQPAGEPEEEIAPALAGSVEEQGFDAGEADMESPSGQLEEKLESFFAEDAVPTPESRQSEEGLEVEEPEAAEDEEEHPFAFELEQDIAPALADSEDDTGFAAPGTEVESPFDELTDRLESFFGEEETPVETAEVGETQAAPAEERTEEPVEASAEEAEEEIAPALAGSAEEAGFSPTEADATSTSKDLEKKLDFFFGEEEDKTGAEEEVLLTQALEEPDEEKDFRTDEQIRFPAKEEEGAMLSPQEYEAAIQQMKSAFAELENSLRLEISSLRREVESLRSRLNG